MVLMLFCSFSSIAPTEMALRYNRFFRAVDKEVIAEPGLRFIAPWNTLLRYPKTITTIEYKGFSALDGRTSDGLPLTLGIAFQYQLNPVKLYDLYHTYEQQSGTYEAIYKTIGAHLITEIATNYTAYEFFNNKQKIANTMRAIKNEYYEQELYAGIKSLPINEDDLPVAFTDAVLQAATEKQNITKMQKFKESQMVVFGTARVVARAQANVTVNSAKGDVHRIEQNGIADANIIEAYVEAERNAYSQVKSNMNLEGDALIDYIWYDSLQGGGVAETQTGGQDTQILVGVNPAAYINEQ
jgi:hypothetical protein